MSSRGFFLLRADTVRIVTSIRLQYSIFSAAIQEILRYLKCSFVSNDFRAGSEAERTVATWLKPESKRIVLFALIMDNAAVFCYTGHGKRRFPFEFVCGHFLNPSAFPSISPAARFDGHTVKIPCSSPPRKSGRCDGILSGKDKSFRHPMMRRERVCLFKMPSEE